jgi:hypothetical protein
MAVAENLATKSEKLETLHCVAMYCKYLQTVYGVWRQTVDLLQINELQSFIVALYIRTNTLNMPVQLEVMNINLILFISLKFVNIHLLKRLRAPYTLRHDPESKHNT